jgi:beta-mannanase
MKKYLAIAAAAAIALAGVAVSLSAHAQYPSAVAEQTLTPATTAASTMLWGSFVDSGVTETTNFETMVGHKMDLQAVFVSWDDPTNHGVFPVWYEPVIRDAGKTMIIFWEPAGTSTAPNQPQYNNDTIINGVWDSYITSFAKASIQYGAPYILVPMEEMNGDWYLWNGTLNGNTSMKFIAAWRHIHDLFVAAGATNVKFGWAVNSNSVPNVAGNQINDYYPGDAYVDYVGVDGFNLNDGWGWFSFNEIFQPALAQLQTYNKPIVIFSIACTKDRRKAAWITDALGTQVYKYPIAAWVWFNKGILAVDTDKKSLAAFKAVIPN